MCNESACLFFSLQNVDDDESIKLKKKKKRKRKSLSDDESDSKKMHSNRRDHDDDREDGEISEEDDYYCHDDRSFDNRKEKKRRHYHAETDATIEILESTDSSMDSERSFSNGRIQGLIKRTFHCMHTQFEMIENNEEYFCLIHSLCFEFQMLRKSIHHPFGSSCRRQM